MCTQPFLALDEHMELFLNGLVVPVSHYSFLVGLRRDQRSMDRYSRSRIRLHGMTGDSRSLDNLVVVSSGVHRLCLEPTCRLFPFGSERW